MANTNNSVFNKTFYDMQGEKVSYVSRAIEGTYLSLVGLLACTGNICLWIIVTRNKNLRNNSNLHVLCLSMADLLVSVVNVPLTVLSLYANEWLLPDSVCIVAGFMNMITFVASVLSLAAISVNRYMLICHGPTYKRIYTDRNTIFIFTGVWLLSVILASPPLFGWASYTYIENQFFCFCDWTRSISFTIFMVAICFGCPCSVMSFCYIGVLKEVRRSRKSLQKHNRPPTPTEATSAALKEASEDNVDNDDDDDEGNKHVTSAAGETSGDVEGYEPTTSKSGNNLSAKWKPTSSVQRFEGKTENGKSNNKKKKIKSNKIKSRSYTVTQMTAGQLKRQKRRQEEIKLTTTLLVVILIFIVSWLPYCVTMFYNVFGSQQVPHYADILAIFLGYTNSCYNPWIYGATNQQFRIGFKQLLCKMRFPRKNTSTKINPGGNQNDIHPRIHPSTIFETTKHKSGSGGNKMLSKSDSRSVIESPKEKAPDDGIKGQGNN